VAIGRQPVGTGGWGIGTYEKRNKATRGPDLQESRGSPRPSWLNVEDPKVNLQTGRWLGRKREKRASMDRLNKIGWRLQERGEGAAGIGG